MSDDKSRPLSMPEAEAISGTLDNLAKKYKAATEVGLRPITAKTVNDEIANVLAEIKETKSFGIPEAELLAGKLESLAKKYKNAGELDLRAPLAETIKGTLDALCKKYTG